MQTGTFKAGDTASGVAKSLGISTADFLKYNPNLAAKGHPNDYQGLTGLIQPGQAYNYAAPSKIINTSTNSRIQTNQASSALEQALAKMNMNNNPQGNKETVDNSGTESDPIMMSLEKLQNSSDAATKSLIASTRAAYQNQKSKVTMQYEDYKRGLQELGIQTNQARSTPDLLAGHIQKAGNDQMEKINSLTAEESKAVMDAMNAKENNDFRVLKEKMDYVKQIKQEKANAIKEMYDNIANAGKIADIQAHDIYDTLQGLGDADKEAFIQAVANKYNIPLLSLVTALKDEKIAREDKAKADAKKAGTGTEKITVQNASAEIKSHLKPISQGGILGDDGYMAPEDWVQLRDTWIINKLPIATFNTLYKRYLNPASYDMAGFKSDTGGDLLPDAEQ
jgi:hypothetical protein